MDNDKNETIEEFGEIRDKFSAEVAVQSALTGHKVLTAFHTEDSIGGLVRLANIACNKIGIGMHDESDTLLTATMEADLLGVSEIDVAKLEVILEDSVEHAI